MQPRTRNAIAETIAILGIMNAAIPSWSATTHIPTWVGLTITLLITVGNQLLKDYEKLPPQ